MNDNGPTTNEMPSASGMARSPSTCRSTFDASLYFIGRIRTPWTRREDCPKNARESDAVCTLDIDPRWARRSPTSKVAATWWCFIG